MIQADDNKQTRPIRRLTGGIPPETSPIKANSEKSEDAKPRILNLQDSRVAEEIMRILNGSWPRAIFERSSSAIRR
jgi:hypothetical protein